MPNAYERPLKREVPLDLPADADIPDRFIAALRELIREMKTTGTGYKRYELKKGRRTETAGGDILYHFPFTEEVELFLEAQIELQVGQRRVEGTIASIGDGRLLLALKKDIGDEVRSAVLLIDGTGLLKALKEKIEAVNKGEITLNRSLADAVVQSGALPKRPARPIRADDGSELDDRQRKAYQNALREALTFIWGPPGCGKTMTLSAIVRSAFNSGKRTLICSNTNKAVDQVLYKICETLTHEHPAMEEGKVVRLGRIADDKLASEYSKYVVIDEIVERRSAKLAKKKEQLEEKIARVDAETQKSKQQRDELGSQIRKTENEIAALEKITLIKRQLEREIAALGEYDVIEQHTAELEEKKRQLEEKITRVDAETQKSKQQCDELAPQIREAEAEIAALEKTMRKKRQLENEIAALGKTVRRKRQLEKKIAALGEYDTMERRSAELAEKKRQLEKKIAALEEYDAMERRSAELAKKKEQLEKKIAQLDAKTQTAQQCLAQFKALDKAERRIKTEMQNINQTFRKGEVLKKELSHNIQRDALESLRIKMRIREFKEQSATAIQRFDQAEQMRDDLQSTVAGKDKTNAQAIIDKSKQQRDELFTQIRETEAEIAALEKITLIKRQLEEENAALEKTVRKKRQLEKENTALGEYDIMEQHTAELKKKKQQLEEGIAQLDAKTQKSKQQHNELGTQIRETKAEIAALEKTVQKKKQLEEENAALEKTVRKKKQLEKENAALGEYDIMEQHAAELKKKKQQLEEEIVWIDTKTQKSKQQHNELGTQIRETKAEIAALEKTVQKKKQLEEGNAALEEYDTMEQRLAKLQKKKRQFEKKIAQVDAKTQKSKQQRDELFTQIRETEAEIAAFLETKSTMLRDARIVGATCTKAYLTKGIGQLDLVIVDEASMVLRPAVWFSAGLASERVVISGDFRQIPPIVPTQQETIFQELGLDPFTATDRTKPDAPGLAMLTTQYRMHPSICGLISEPMYEGKLRTSPARKKVLGRLPPNPFEKPLTIIDTSDLRPVESQNASFSRLNKLHALLVRNFVRHLRLNGVIETNRDLGICTPYSAQARHIQKLLKEDGPDNLVHCGTVHRFQGDERRIVLLEIPESGGHRAIGQFVQGVPPDHVGARLISVAVSRAQEHFVVLANLTHLDKRLPSNSLLRSILHKIEQQGRVVPGGELLKLYPIDSAPTDLPHQGRTPDQPPIDQESVEHKRMNREQAEELLQKAVGNPNARFRDGQWEAIDAVSNRRAKLLLVQRTGWGKSAVYFVATRIFRDAGRGPTIIVSPLLALMRNQVEAAQRLGIRAASIDSSNRDDWDAIITDVINDQIDALLITPERLANENFRQSTLMKIADRIGLLVVDEAHCISDWGHDFRPDYRRLTNVLRMLPRNTPVLGTTATANDRVIGDIKTQLADFQIQRGPLSRHSLSLQTIRLDNQASRLAWLAQSIPQIPGSGIVYVLTKRDAEQVAAYLSRHSISARAYHGGADHDKRCQLENMLLNNEIKVLVATTALGMGYDKPDLSFVIHYQAPSSVVAYYQQVGRAGRAIPSAVGILLVGKEDEQIHDYFRRTAFPSEHAVEEVLNALEESDGKSIAELQNQLNMHKSQIEHVLKVLSVEVPSPAIKVGSKWHRTAAEFELDQERIHRLSSQRDREWQEFQEYVDTDNCFMEYLGRMLDDPAVERCGKCANCMGKPVIATAVEHALEVEAVRFLRRSELPFEPRTSIRKGVLPTYGFPDDRLEPELQASEGRILSQWGDAGWGALVAADKESEHFRDELVHAVAEMIRERWQPDPPVEWVTCVPSLRCPALVPDFARRLADELKLPFCDVIQKVRDCPPQKQQENTFHQCRNLDGAFNVAGGVPASPVLLVDDVVDSRWTMTVLAALLRRSGSGLVYPVGLASASIGG